MTTDETSTHTKNGSKRMNKTLYYVAQTINETYKVPIDKAINIVNNSFLPELLNKMPDFIQHYDTEYWADELISVLNKGDAKHV